MNFLGDAKDCLAFAEKNPLKTVMFVGYKNWAFTLYFETHPSEDHPHGTRGTFMAGGYGDNIEFYTPLSLDWEEHGLAEFQWLEYTSNLEPLE
ncbi:hypothetical protein [Mollivirus kamchatka]|nr:hypothetical protein [Mollivirus kamchatka]